MKEIQQILAALASAQAGEIVLATLVKVEGSSYRRPGARLLLTADGRRIGSISGGCLEDDIIAHAQQVRASGLPEVFTYDTTSENDLVWGVGLGCQGIVHVFVERLPLRPAWVAALRENFRRRKPTALAVVWREPAEMRSVRSFPGDATPSSHVALEPRRGRRGSRTPAAPLAGSQREIAALGTCLAGDLASLPSDGVYLQTIRPPTALVVFGAGDDVQPLVRFAKELGWHVTVADHRPAFATPKRFPGADATVVVHAEDAVAGLNPEAGSVAVIMTHNYRNDVRLLGTLLTRPLAYLGLLGPRKRTDRILAELEAGGLAIDPGMRGRLRAPVGLDLGADNPEEVALAILAEMQAVLAGRDARPLRDRKGPIHAG